jgi:hypothetical protein
LAKITFWQAIAANKKKGVKNKEKSTGAKAPANFLS